MLTARYASVIELVVRSYIATAEPVSSAEIALSLQPEVSSATVRNDMADLTEEGYLLKPHTSAGRVPTALAYRFVTERMLEREHAHQVVSTRSVGDPAEVAKRVSERSHAVAYIANRNGVGVAGFEFVLTAPELASQGAALEALAHLVDALPRWADELYAALEGRVDVFVAEDNPIHPSGYFSIVATRLPHEGVAAVIGPLRMRYEDAIQSLINL